jgi:hypothetical protein
VSFAPFPTEATGEGRAPGCREWRTRIFKDEKINLTSEVMSTHEGRVTARGEARIRAERALIWECVETE